MARFNNHLLKLLHKVFSNMFTQSIILFSAIIILFIGDVEIAFIPRKSIGITHMIVDILFILFILEFIVANLVEKDYPLSSYFLIDFIDLFSLATEVDFIWGPFLRYLDKLLRANYEINYVISKSQFANLAGITLDAETIKYITFFRIIGYLKIMRIAKVIVTTKRIRFFAKKTRNATVISLSLDSKKCSITKGRRNKMTAKSDINLALKYLDDFEKFNNDLDLSSNLKNSFFNGNLSNITSSYVIDNLKGRSSSQLQSQEILSSKNSKLKLMRQNNKFSPVKQRKSPSLNSFIKKKKVSDCKSEIFCLKGLQLFQPKISENELKYLSLSLTNKIREEQSSEIGKSKLRTDKIFMSMILDPSNSDKKRENNAKSYFLCNLASKKSNERKKSQEVRNNREKHSIEYMLDIEKEKRICATDDSCLSDFNQQYFTNRQTKILQKHSKPTNSALLFEDKLRRDSWSFSSIKGSKYRAKASYEATDVDISEISKIDNVQVSKFESMTKLHDQSNHKLIQKINPQNKKRASLLVTYLPKKLVVPETVKEEEESEGKISENNNERKQEKEITSMRHSKSHSIVRSRSSNFNRYIQGNTIEVYNRLLVKNMENKDYNSFKSLLNFGTLLKQNFASKLTIQLGLVHKNEQADQMNEKNMISLVDDEASSNLVLSTPGNSAYTDKEEYSPSKLDIPIMQQTLIIQKSKFPGVELNNQLINLAYDGMKVISSQNSLNAESSEITKNNALLSENEIERKFTLRNANSIESLNNDSELMKSIEEINFNKQVFKQVNLKDSLKRIDEDTEKNDSEIDENYAKQINSCKSSRPSITSNLIMTDRAFVESSPSKYKDSEILTISSSESESENEIDYDCVPGLEAPDQVKKKKEEALLIETVLFKNMTIKIVLFKMAIVIGLQFTQNDYVQDLFNYKTPSRIDFCISTIVNRIEDITKNETTSCKFEYIQSLNYTITDCFYGMSGGPSDNQASILPEVNYFNPSDNDQLFIYINFTRYAHMTKLKLLCPTYLQNFSLVLANNDFESIRSQFILNLDYYYSFYYVDDDNFIEYLVDISYGTFLDKILSIIRYVFVTTIIIITSISLGKDIKSKIMIPTTKIINKFRYFFNSDTLSYVNILLESNKEEEEIILNRKLGQFSYYFDLTLGKRVLNLISQSSDISSSIVPINLIKPGIMVSGTALYIHLSVDTDYVIQDALYDLNRLYTIFHSLSYGFGGDIINQSIAIWKSRAELFELNHLEYSKEIIENHKRKTNKLLNYYKPVFTYLNDNEVSSKCSLDTNLALLCSIELISTLVTKFRKLILKLRSNGISFNVFLFQDNFIYGYIGTSSTFISQNLLSKNKKQVDRYLSNKMMELPSVFACSDTYSDLHKDLQAMCFPFDVFEGKIYYKLNSTSENIGVDPFNDESETEMFNVEFNISRAILMKGQIAELMKGNFEVLIELLYMTKHIAKYANSTIKSLLKLGFHYLFMKDFVKVVQILSDTINLFEAEEYPDIVLLKQVNSIKSKALQKLKVL